MSAKNIFQNVFPAFVVLALGLGGAYFVYDVTNSDNPDYSQDYASTELSEIAPASGTPANTQRQTPQQKAKIEPRRIIRSVNQQAILEINYDTEVAVPDRSNEQEKLKIETINIGEDGNLYPVVREDVNSVVIELNSNTVESQDPLNIEESSVATLTEDLERESKMEAERNAKKARALQFFIEPAAGEDTPSQAEIEMNVRSKTIKESRQKAEEVFDNNVDASNTLKSRTQTQGDLQDQVDDIETKRGLKARSEVD